MYKQVHPSAKISIESNTDSVPNDGKYYLIKKGKTVSSFRTLKAAEVEYKRLLSEIPLPDLSKRQIKVSAQHMMNEHYLSMSNNALLGTNFGIKGKKAGRFHKSR